MDGIAKAKERGTRLAASQSSPRRRWLRLGPCAPLAGPCQTSSGVWVLVRRLCIARLIPLNSIPSNLLADKAFSILLVPRYSAAIPEKLQTGLIPPMKSIGCGH